MRSQQLSVRQAAIWGLMYNMGTSIVVLPALLAKLAMKDAWLSVVVAMLLQLMLVPVFGVIGRQMNGRTFLEYLTALFGKAVSIIILMGLVLIHSMLSMGAALRSVGDFITTVFIAETPIEIIHMTFLVAVIYGLRKGINTMGAAAEILLPIILLLLTVLLAALTPNLQTSLLLPILDQGFKPVLHGAITMWGLSFSSQIVILFLLPHLPKGAPSWPVFFYSTILCAIPTIIVTAFSIMIFSATGTGWLTFPGYNMASVINIGEFFERVESMVAFIWIVASFYEVSIHSYVVGEGFAQIFSISSYKLLIIPIALFGYKLAELVWSNVNMGQEIIMVWPYYSALTGLLLPLLCMVTGLIRKKSLQRKLA